MYRAGQYWAGSSLPVCVLWWRHEARRLLKKTQEALRRQCAMELIQAVALDDPNEVRRLLKLCPAAAQECDETGLPPIAWAVREDRVKTLQVLLRHNSGEVCEWGNGWSPLTYAARHGRVGALACLLQIPGMNVNRPTSTGRLALIEAAQGQSTAAIHALSEHRRLHPAWSNHPTQMDIEDPAGKTPLVVACLMGNAVVVEELVCAGCDPEYETHDGWWALAAASAMGQVEAAKILLQLGADPNQKSLKAPHGATGNALSQALWGGHKEVAELLVSFGAEGGQFPDNFGPRSGGNFGEANPAAVPGGVSPNAKRFMEAPFQFSPPRALGEAHPLYVAQQVAQKAGQWGEHGQAE